MYLYISTSGTGWRRYLGGLWSGGHAENDESNSSQLSNFLVEVEAAAPKAPPPPRIIIKFFLGVLCILVPLHVFVNTTLILRQGEFSIQAETITNIILISYDNIGALEFINTGESQSGDRDLYEQSGNRSGKRSWTLWYKISIRYRFLTPPRSSLPPQNSAGGETRASPDAASGVCRGAQGAAPTPGTALGVATREAGPGSPAPRPAHPTTPHPAHWTLGYLSCLTGWPGGKGECLEVARDTERTLVHRFKF